MFGARHLGIVAIAVVLLSGCASDLIVKSPPGTATTLIMLRHAERPAFGTELTDKGRARARALPAALQGVPIDAIYSPDFSRNLDTVAPLARRRGLSVKVIKPSLAAGYAARLIRENPGKTVLWVGNLGNLKEIYANIGGEGEPPLTYGDLYFVRVPDEGPIQVIKSRYGT